MVDLLKTIGRTTLPGQLFCGTLQKYEKITAIPNFNIFSLSLQPTMTPHPRNCIFELEMKVRDYEVDYEGIVNNAVYLNYFEHTRHEFCEQAGLSFASMHRRGIDPVVRRAEIDYLSPLRSADRFVSRLSLERSGPRFIFMQEILRLPAREPAVRARITVACIENGKLTRGDSLAEAFSNYLD